jgi:hypothetical protein
MKPKIYLAGPYRNAPDRNTQQAAYESARLTALGYTVYSPHLQSHRPAKVQSQVGIDWGPQDERWLDVVAAWIPVCEGIALFGDWQDSEGCQAEIKQAQLEGLIVAPIDEYPDAEEFWEWNIDTLFD